jgi:glycosyltransferase involved in cell wall biosynthesis
MAMELSDLTIIVPTKDEAHNIGRFLQSVPRNVKLIVVDSSTDDTADRALSLRPQATRVLKVQAPIVLARQLGAQAATTPWLLFTDADVTFDDHYFNNMRRYRACDAIYGPKHAQDYFAAYYRLFSLGQQWFGRIGIPAATGSNLAVKRRVFLAAGGFDLELLCNEDSEFGWRLARQGYRVLFGADLVVHEHDHRRLRRGVVRSTGHSVVRCAPLYTGLMPRRWRRLDWGYWSPR